MNIYELAEKVGGEIVGGRLIGVVDGKKQYLSEVGSDGQAFLTPAGLLLANEPIPEVTVEEVVAITEEPPKRKKKSETDVDDVQIEI